MFVGEADAGERSAIIYTIIESCRRRGLDPSAYLRHVLTRLPNMTNRQIAEVTPPPGRKARSNFNSQRKRQSQEPSTLTPPTLHRRPVNWCPV